MIRSLLACALVVCVAPAARADWSKLSSASGKYLVDVSAPDDAHVFTAGFALSGGGFSTSAQTHVAASPDGGHTFADVSGTLSTTSSLQEIATATVFFDDTHGFVAIGHHVARTSDGGKSWTLADVGFGVNALAFLDARRGIAVGANGNTSRTSDGGATWSATTTPVSTTLRHVVSLDEKHVFASGHEVDSDTGHPSGGVLVASNDGGVTWKKGADVDGGVTSIFYLCDAKTGFVAASRWDDSSGDVATLYTTTDGGATLVDANLPRAVGKLNAPFGGTQALQTGEILAQWWDDAKHGHLGALAYLGTSTQSQSGGGESTSETQDLWRVVDYVTTDGATWIHSDLGTISVSLTGGGSDGAFTAGTFRDFEHGWLVGGDGVVWGFTHACHADADCANGYTCASAQCVARAARNCSAPPSENTGGSSGSASTPDGLGRVGDGCGCSAPASVSALALLSLFARRRRARV